jgi:hypothetical protein
MSRPQQRSRERRDAARALAALGYRWESPRRRRTGDDEDPSAGLLATTDDDGAPEASIPPPKGAPYQPDANHDEDDEAA